MDLTWKTQFFKEYFFDISVFVITFAAS